MIQINGKEILLEGSSDAGKGLSEEDFEVIRFLFAEGCRQRLSHNQDLEALVKKNVVSMLPATPIDTEAFIRDSQELVQDIMDDVSADLVRCGHFEPDVDEMTVYADIVMERNYEATVLQEFEAYQNEHMKQLSITGATLLSKEEFEANHKLFANHLELPSLGIPLPSWLRSPGSSSEKAFVFLYDYCSEMIVDASHCVSVRPVLLCDAETTSLTPGDQLILNGQKYTALFGNCLLKIDPIDYAPFRKEYTAADANVYEASDVKKLVDEWYQKEFGRTISSKDDVER